MTNKLTSHQIIVKESLNKFMIICIILVVLIITVVTYVLISLTSVLDFACIAIQEINFY